MNHDQLLPQGTRLGAVHLSVTDAERARLFWTRYVGLTELPSTDDTIRLGAGNEPLIILYPNADSPVAARRTGLYHVAIHVPSKRDLAVLVARLAALEYGQSPTDHTSTMATYFSDPDGHGIEITFETPERGEMLILPDGRPAARLNSDGSYRGVTEALDVEELFTELNPDDDVSVPLPAGTRIGHVHLHVQDIDEGKRFYVELLGLHSLLHMTDMGMSDFGLDTTTMPHSLAINRWNGPRAEPAPAGTAALSHWELNLPGAADLTELKQRLDAASWEYTTVEGGISLDDPSGNTVKVLLP